jgi:hypothetical protein
LPDLPFVCPDSAEPLVDRHVQRKAPPPGAFPDQGQRVLDRGGKVEVRQLELHPPGFDLRQIEDVVDEGQQVLGERARLGKQRGRASSDAFWAQGGSGSNPAPAAIDDLG